MKIKYLGHSSFLLTDGRGTAIVCDPYPQEVGYAMPAVRADAVTVSHHHFDHDYVRAVKGDFVLIDGECDCEVKGIKISSFYTFHDDCGGAKRGKNLIFKYYIDGLTVCHMGDLGEKCSPAIVEAALADVLLIPVGGNYTIDGAEAKRYIEKIKPKVVIPMHYSAEGCNIDIEKADAFLSLFDGDGNFEIKRTKGEISLSRGDMCGSNALLIVMDRSDK